MKEINLQTLTPLWTGDIEQKCNQIKETGIIGSLRWWYEALVRGLGGSACDPTDSKCQFNYKKYNETKEIESGLEDVCDACRLFGCTGWSRRFRIAIKGGKTLYDGNLKVIMKKNRKSAWYLPSGIFGNPNIKISGKQKHEEVILSLLKFISRCGGIGAKTQQGYGIFRLFENDKPMKMNVERLIKVVEDNIHNNISFEQRYLPNFKDFFFCNLTFSDEKKKKISKEVYFKSKKSFQELKLEKKFVFPIAPLFRYKIRSHFRESGNEDLRHFLMGFMGIGYNKTTLNLGTKSHKSMSSKIFVSNAYKTNNQWKIKIWGFLPQYVRIETNNSFEIKKFNEIFNVNRNKILENLKRKIEDFYDGFNLKWVECDSKNIKEFMKKVVENDL